MMNRIACCLLVCSTLFISEINAQRNGAYIVNDRNKPYLELRNGLLGLVIPKETTYNAREPQKTLAPVQSIIYSNGAFSDKTPNYFQGATRSQVYPSSMKVTITKNDPGECIVTIRYTFNKPAFTYGNKSYKGGEAGVGFYTCTISLKKDARSALIEEDTDYDIYYQVELGSGFNPDRARYRGWAATSKDKGYEPNGTVYRGEDKRAPMDATVNLSFTDRVIFPFLSQWQAAGAEINTGRYWQVYNSKQPSSGALVGFFHGKPSRMIGARSCGVGLIVNVKNKSGKYVKVTEDTHVALYVQSIRSGADNVWFPRKRFQWGLFISTKKDLLPATRVQPIGVELNYVSGVARKVDEYASKQAGIIPAFFEGALYMPAEQLQNVMRKIKSDKNFYSSQITIDPYFKPVLDAWRFPDSARNVIRAAIRYGEELKKELKNGDGIHAPNIKYWKGAYNFKRMAMRISCLFADKSINISASQKESLLQVIRLMARIEWDDDNVPLFDGSGAYFGTENMPHQFRNNGRNFFALLFATDPEFRNRAEDIYKETKQEIETIISANGISFGSPHYIQAAIDPVLFTMLQLKQATAGDLFLEQKNRLEKFIDFYKSLLTPPSVRFNGNRKLVSFGDGSEESAVTFGLLATGFAGIDNSLADNLYGIYKNGPARFGFFGHLLMVIDLARNPGYEFYSGPSNYTGYLSHLRSGINTHNETAVWILNGDRFYDHRNNDRGEVAIYALKAPLSVSWSSFYTPRANDARIRSLVVPEKTFPQWNKSLQPFSSDQSNHVPWLTSDQLEFSKTKYITLSRSKMMNKDTAWYRNTALIAINEEQPVILLWDSLNNNIPAIWSMLFMAEGPVATPAGAIKPATKIYDNKLLKQLPEATAEKKLQQGLNRFSFTGQQWSKQLHPFGGINWDLFTYSPRQSSFTISQWTNTWQNSVEAAEYLKIYKKPYSEAQHIFRWKNAAPSFAVILPYNKNSNQNNSRVRLTAQKQIEITNNRAKYLITSQYLIYAEPGRKMFATFSGKQLDEEEVGIEGGAAEVELEDNTVKIRIHGNSGQRVIRIKGSVSTSREYKNITTRSAGRTTIITIRYESNGLNLLSTEKGYSEFVFNRN